jgi:hypothetical protein
MNNENPASKDIDIKTQEGLELLKAKAVYYDYYAEQLKVLELIEEIEYLRINTARIETDLYNAETFLGWYNGNR